MARANPGPGLRALGLGTALAVVLGSSGADAGSVPPAKCRAELLELCVENRALTISRLQQLPTADLDDAHPMSVALKSIRDKKLDMDVRGNFPDARYLFRNRKEHDARIRTLKLRRYCKCSVRGHHDFLGPEIFADMKCGTGPSPETVQKTLELRYQPKRAWEIDLACLRQNSR